MISGARVRGNLAFAGLIAALVTCASHAAGFAAPELMRLLASVQSSRARFIETRHSDLLKKPLVLRGTLAYTRPDRLEKHVLSPYDELTVIEGSRLTLHNRTTERRKSADVASSPGLAALVESMRATRAGDLSALERHYALDVAGQREQWILTLRPNEPQLGALVRKVTIHGFERRISRVEVEEANGDRTITELTEDVR
jgi:outer membrane lipoprotein-sorting protein